MTTEMTGRFSRLIDHTVFYYYVDKYGKPLFDLDLRDKLVERMQAFIFGKDDVYRELLFIGFGDDSDRAAIDDETLVNDDDDDIEWPVVEAFEHAGWEWLTTTDGLEAALNYDTQSEGVVIPLQDAINNPDDLPITANQFAELLVRHGYAVEVEEVTA
jgi:hypothetical protein